MTRDDDTRRALRHLAVSVAEGDLSERDVEHDVSGLCGSRGDLTAYFRRCLELERRYVGA